MVSYLVDQMGGLRVDSDRPLSRQEANNAADFLERLMQIQQSNRVIDAAQQEMGDYPEL